MRDEFAVVYLAVLELIPISPLVFQITLKMFTFAKECFTLELNHCSIQHSHPLYDFLI